MLGGAVDPGESRGVLDVEACGHVRFFALLGPLRLFFSPHTTRVPRRSMEERARQARPRCTPAPFGTGSEPIS